MKANIYRGNGGLSYEDIPIPEIDDDEILLKVEICGLCKTDVKKIKNDLLEPPRIFGHEIVGTIADVGRKIKAWKEGDRVAVFHHVPCLTCFYCREGKYSLCKTYRTVDTSAGFVPSGGGFAECVKVPRLVVERGLIKIPDNVSFEEAVFIEPTNCCLKAVKKANIQLGDYVMVLGQGPIGLTHNQLAKLWGAKVIATDLVDYRLEKAKEFGADYTFNARNRRLSDGIKEVTKGKGADIAIVAVESIEALEQALEAVRPGGKVVVFGEVGKGKRLSLDPNIIYGSEIELIGSYSSSFTHHELSAEIVFERKIKTTEMITHRYKLKDLAEAVDLANMRRDVDWAGHKLAGRPRENLKILVYP